MKNVKSFEEFNNTKGDRIVEKSVDKKYKDVIAAQNAVLGKLDNIRTLCIMSPQNPLGVKSTNKDNRKNKKSFERFLKNGFYAYHKVLGKYNQYEESYFLYNISLEDAKRLNLEYMQESFIFMTNKNGRLTFYAYKYNAENGDPHYELKGSTDESIYNMKDADNFFTKIGNKFKFNIPFDDSVFETMLSFVDKYNMVLENNKNDYMSLLDDILDDSKTGNSKYMSRMLLYGKKQQK